MKRNKGGAKRRQETIQVWSHERARAAIPYIAAVVRSLREHWLDATAKHETARRLSARPGRPDRAALIAEADALRDAREAEDRFEDARVELESLDVYCLDPSAGLALIPFMHDNLLAWYVFDLFSTDPIRFWRFHSDPLKTRRPLTQLLGHAAGDAGLG
jgi:hypothetical protein